MYDSLWEENPKVQQIQAKAAEEGRKEGLAEGRKEGLTEGRVASSRESVMKIVKKRFPKLAEPALQRVAQIQSYEALDMLMDILLDAPDEASARIILRLTAA